MKINCRKSRNLCTQIFVALLTDKLTVNKILNAYSETIILCLVMFFFIRDYLLLSWPHHLLTPLTPLFIITLKYRDR